MSRMARLVVTHADPDLDAVGFVYSARRVLDPAVPVACRRPTREELEDPTVIVGDIGLLGCEAIGHSPELNNFDHHYSPATRSATFLFNEVYGVMTPHVVEYIDQVDTRPSSEVMDSTLRVAMAGVRVQYSEGVDKDQLVLAAGQSLRAWIEETGRKPGDLKGPFPPQVETCLCHGREELRRIREELRRLQEDRTAAGRRVGYLVTRSPVFSLVKEEMFAAGMEIAVVHAPGTKRLSIACNAARVKGINLKEGGLIPALDELERRKGLAREKGWGGHEDRIGSPKPSASLLTADDVLAIVRAVL